MKNNTNYIFLLSLLFLISTGVLAWYVSDQISKKIEVVREYYIQESKNNNMEFSKKLKDEMYLLNEQENKLKSTFLISEEIVNFIKELEFSAQNLGLGISVEKLEYGTPEVLEGKYNIKPIKFNVEITGSFRDIEFFISKLKNSEKKLAIKELKLYQLGQKENLKYSARIIIEGITISYE